MKFSPYAWAKLMYMRDRGECEVGGFGITRADDFLFIEDFVIVKQEVSAVSVLFNDAAVADFFDNQTFEGRKPAQFARTWIHTHPGNSAAPSSVDEETFARVFGNCDFSIMFILARGGQYYARLSFGGQTPGWLDIPVEVDFTQRFPASDHELWAEEYDTNVTECKITSIFDSWPADAFLTHSAEELDDFLEVNAGYTRDELVAMPASEKKRLADEFEREVYQYE